MVGQARGPGLLVGARLDEGVALLLAFFGGELVDHHGDAFTASEVTVLPRPVQRPRPPLWFAARGGSAKRPLRRAARFDGLVPIELEDGDHLSRMLDVIVAERGSLDGFDTMVGTGLDVADIERRGATWSYHSFATTASAAEVFGYIGRGRWAD